MLSSSDLLSLIQLSGPPLCSQCIPHGFGCGHAPFLGLRSFHPNIPPEHDPSLASDHYHPIPCAHHHSFLPSAGRPLPTLPRPSAAVTSPVQSKFHCLIRPARVRQLTILFLTSRHLFPPAHLTHHPALRPDRHPGLSLTRSTTPLPRVHRPNCAHLALYKLARRIRHRWSCRLRYDDLHRLPRGHYLHRSSRLDG